MARMFPRHVFLSSGLTLSPSRQRRLLAVSACPALRRLFVGRWRISTILAKALCAGRRAIAGSVSLAGFEPCSGIAETIVEGIDELFHVRFGRILAR